MEEDTEYLKLPVEERLIHKLWKARVSGYEEATKSFGQWDEDDPNWRKFMGLAKKMVTDSNAVAQEKGLVCCLAFAENCKGANKTAGEVIDGIVSKCVAAAKTKTKELATEIILMYCEIEAHEKVIEQLLSGLSQKNPKVVSGCVANIANCLRLFGAKVIKVSPLLKGVLPLMDHRDKDVREQGKKVIIESYRWIGEVMKSQLNGLKPVQLTELQTEFDNLEGVGKAKPERWLRSAGPPKEAKAAEGEDDEEEEEEESQQSDLDPYELLDPVEILSKLPKNFYEQVEEKKWQLRKESLDALLPLSQNPKLLPGDFGDLVRVLKKFIQKDTNVMLVALAAQCLAGLAKGLRTGFKSYANVCLPVLLEKFKEKKLNVVTALKDCVDAIYPSLGIEAIQEDCLASLKHKTPQVKAETAGFLARCFAKCPPVLVTNKKIMKGYVSALLEALNEPDPSVREASALALGTLFKFIGEGKIMAFLVDVDKLKLEKIKELAETVELTGKSAAPKAAKPKPKPEPVKVVKPSDKKPASAKPGENKKVVKSGGASAAAKPKKSTASKPTAVPSGGVASESDLSIEEVEARAEEVFPDSVTKNLGDTNWKTRLAAIEEAKSSLESATTFPGLVAVKLLCKKPGLKDNNFQALGAKIASIGIIATKIKWTQQCWDAVTPDIVEKLGDNKNCEACKETLYLIAESSSFNFVFGGVLDTAFSAKSPKVKSEALSWAGEGIKTFGFGGLQPKGALECIKKGLADTNPAVRTGSIQLLAIIHWYMGAIAKRMFENEKAALLEQIDKECDKFKGQALPIPTRGGKAKSGGGQDDGDVEDEEAEVQMEDLVPRQNIAGSITDELIEMLKDKNWKIRKEGLDKVKDIVSTAKFIKGDLGDLPAALTLRTTDTNKNLAIQAIEMVSDLALAMGPHSKPQVPNLLPGVLNALADSKPNVRQAALAAINTFLQETSLRDLFVNDIFCTALTKGNPFVKQEVFMWMAGKLPEGKGVPKDELSACLPILYSGIEDRSAEVRKATQEAVPGFMKHLGYESMRKATDKLSAVSKNGVMPVLEKARAALPPPAAKPSSARPARDPSEQGRASSAKPSSDDGGTSEKPQKSARPAVKGRAGSAKPSIAKKEDKDVDSSPPYSANKLKNTRFRDEAKLKLLKWNFAVPRPEFVEQLKDQMESAGFNKSLMAQMFHNDFKQHLKAIEMLTGHTESDLEGLISNLDLLLKWMTLRFFETNPSVILKGLEYLTLVFCVLSESDESYNLHDIEASSFIPYLITKIGDGKDQVRNSCKAIVKTLCQLYPASKLFLYLLDGLKSKSAKQRAECLDEMGNLIRGWGTGVCGSTPKVALQEIAKQIADRDVGVRNAALNAVTETYFQEGEKVYKLIGHLPEKDMAMLEERIKRASKSRPPPSAPEPAAPPPQQKTSVGSRQIPNNNKNAGRPGSGLRPPSASSAGAANVPESEVRMRYGPKAGSAGPGSRPISGAFTLDLEKIEAGMERISDRGPELIKHDLDGILNDSPVVLPITRTAVNRPASPDSATKLMNNQEAHQAVNAVIAQIFNQDTQTSISALAQLDELMKDTDKVDLLGSCIDHLFSMCCMQYRYVLCTKMKMDNANGKEVMRLLQYLTMVLMSMYSHRDMVRQASMQVLHDLVNVIVLILLEPGVAELPEGGQLIRALNVLTVKIVDRSDHNAISSALLKLLHECIGTSVLSGKYCELVMKCIWKVIRGLPTWIDKLDVDLLMADLHEFLKAYPASYWKKQEDDTPMRTVKTVIHTLVKEKGESVLNCLSRVSDPNASDLVPYIRKLLNTGVGGDSGQSGIPTRDNSAKKRPPRFTKSDHEALAEIFKKIGQKELTKVGLQELYNFKQQNPHADLEPFLAKSSEYFRDYIERGLKSIEQEVRNGGSGIPAPTNRPSILTDNRTVSGGQPTHLMYLDRLKKLRSAGGLDPANRENVENYSNAPTSTNYSNAPTTTTSGYSSARVGSSSSQGSERRYSDNSQELEENENNQNNAGEVPVSNIPNVDDIRKRLAKIKQSAL